jgi:hypothetical protein
VNRCAVYDCDRPVKARHLCRDHYWRWMNGRFNAEADDEAGELTYARSAVPLVCLCEQPRPDEMGMCTRCGRLIVTFAHANRGQYQETYPMAWQRAEELGLGVGDDNRRGRP